MGARRGFGRLRKRDSGRWQAGYTGPDGAVHNAPETFTAKLDAEAWVLNERRLIELDEWTPPAARTRMKYSKGATLSEYAEPWLMKRTLKPKTRRHYRRLLDTRILPLLGNVELKRLDRASVEAWLETQGSETPTMNAHAYALLRTIANSAIDDGLMKINPCSVRGAGQSKRKRAIEPATLAELQTIVEHMPERHRLAVLLSAWCALRFGELTELRRHDIDLRRERIKVRRGVVRVDGQLIVDSPKTAAGVRTVAIPPHLLPFLRNHLEHHAQPGVNGLLFHGADGGHLSPSTLMGKPARRRKIKGRLINESATAFCRAREAAGRPDLTWHDLRHTGAVLAAQAGATLAELMARLGHTTPAAAMIYQHAAKDRDTEIARRLSAMAAGQQ